MARISSVLQFLLAMISVLRATGSSCLGKSLITRVSSVLQANVKFKFIQTIQQRTCGHRTFIYLTTTPHHYRGSGGLTCEEKQAILDEHNRLRQLVALGQIDGQPSAANMMEMIWDDELAAIAQRWADRCAENHDNSRNVRRFAVGQNIARTWTTRPPGPYDSEPNWRRQISGWFNEVQHYHAGYSAATGHYTQVVWGDTFLIGCGYSFYYDPARGYTKNYVCNYGPSGNVLGFQPYQSGQPACGSYGMSYSNRYAGLCSRGSYYHLGAFCAYG